MAEQWHCIQYPEFYVMFGILYQTSCVATPHKNSVAERKHRHILNVARSLLFQANLPKAFWSYAVTHVAHFINRIPSTILGYRSPFELLHHDSPTLLDLKVFGSLCSVFTLDQGRSKFDPVELEVYLSWIEVWY